MSWLRFATFVALAWVVASSVAEGQTPPRIMIAFDTSGSMAMDLNGVPTFGNGSLDGCTQLGGQRYCGTDCVAGIDTDCDGEPNDSRMYVAGDAVTNMLLSTGGDVEWALARFAQDTGDALVCNAADDGAGGLTGIGGVQDVECGGAVSSYGNPQCNTFSNFSSCGPGNFVSRNDYPPACRPPASGAAAFSQLWYVDAAFNTDGNTLTNPQVCLNYLTSSCDSTAASGQVLVGFPDITGEPFAGMSNVPAILRWFDHTETNLSTSTTPLNFCAHATTGDCEMFPIGPTPLAGVLRASQAYLSSTYDADGRRACRPYAVILLTDGLETCGGNPATVAANLYSAGGRNIRTYVVGMSIASASDRANLNAIAAAGQTGSAFFADNQVTLSAAMSSIVADSVQVEICNDADDDCDGLTDEGVLNACGGCGAVPSEVCNGADDDCDGATDEGVLNACGTCAAMVPTEICDRLDNDCDGTIDEDGLGGTVCGTCTPSAELCDGADNDCDGTVDEDVERSCGSDVGECVAGTETCVVGGTGTFGACVGEVGPTPETCNNRDDDCDGQTDGFSESCGIDTGECQMGNRVCLAGAWGACVGGIGMTPEVCDGRDNDCNGVPDNGDPGGGGACGTAIGECTTGTLHCVGGSLVCQGGTGPTSETCNNRDDDCDNRTDEMVPTDGPCGGGPGECRPGVRTCDGAGNFNCVGEVTSVSEICDGLDNDCNGVNDNGNPGGGLVCGISVGVCEEGLTLCTGGAIVCDGARGPDPSETCNLLDDDCDGLVDEGNPGGGATCGTTDVGECEYGVEACVAGMIDCVGETVAEPELCDGLDNNCNGLTDEGDPEGGGACGDATGECTEGVFRCVAAELMCMGGTGPTPEVCDGLDNDCDGVVDDGIPIGAACGSDVGECVPGVNICRDGGIVCEGEIGVEAETCDNLDNDCDSMIDEGLGLGDACGESEGLCMPGVERCIGGRPVCEGAVGPARETCDCADNDCDGETDEPPDTGNLCPPGSSCVQCQCALPCMESEFGFTCPTGKAPRMTGDECFCVADLCDDDECGTQTVERDGETLCGPDEAAVGDCVCRNNECTFSCDGVLCADGTVCDPRDPLGRCVEDNCRGLGCLTGEICDTDTGECQADPCADVDCPADEACRAGVCEPSCGGVECPAGQSCASGACIDDPCALVTCEGAEVCIPSTGECGADPCRAVTCAGGEVCDVETGNCVGDPCTGLHCPTAQVCEDGECVDDTVEMPDAGVDAGPGIDAGPPRDHHDRVLAAGGCICRVGAAGSSDGTDRPIGLLLFGLFSVVFLRRRRKRASAPRSAS